MFDIKIILFCFQLTILRIICRFPNVTTLNVTILPNFQWNIDIFL